MHDDQEPHDPTTQSMAAREAGRQWSAGGFLDKYQEKNIKPKHEDEIKYEWGEKSTWSLL